MSGLEVAVATRNSKTLYLVVDLLKRLDIGFVLCTPDDKECATAKVVVTTASESKNLAAQSLVVVEDIFNQDTTAIEIMLRLQGILEPSMVVVGVDPGMQIGLALVADGNTIYTKTAQTPSIAANDTLQWIDYFNDLLPSRVLVRVGSGSRLYSALYLRGIQNAFTESRVELVDERHTTKVGESDQSSAVLIAARKGRLVTDDDLVLQVKDGYVKSLKHLFSRITDGKIALTKAEAKSILLDEESIESILDAVVH
ncbi:MAG: hypothetical protein ACE5H4_08655 [Candidatus Thorarchaeota archaeon]